MSLVCFDRPIAARERDRACTSYRYQQHSRSTYCHWFVKRVRQCSLALLSVFARDVSKQPVGAATRSVLCNGGGKAMYQRSVKDIDDHMIVLMS